MLVEGAPGADQFIDIGSEWRQLVDYVVTDVIQHVSRFIRSLIPYTK